MLLWNEIERWNAADVARLAARVSGAARDVRAGAELFSTSLGELSWTGDAADAARNAAEVIDRNYLDRAEELSRMGACVDALADEMYPLMASVRNCVSTAAENSMRIGPAGDVHDMAAVYSAAAEDVWELTRTRRRIQRDLTARVCETMRRATAIDDDAAAALSRIGQAEAGAVVPRTHTVPSSAAAATNAAFWNLLMPAERTELLVRDPGSIGNLDGIPAEVRDNANRRVLASERTRLERVAQALEEQLDRNIFGGVLDNADAGLEQTRKRLDALDEVARTLEQGNRQLLVLDNSSAENTLAAIGVGNVATATHVAVFVPGLGSDVAGDMYRYDSDIDALRTTTERLLPDGDSVACVTWMDYQAPHLGWNLLDPRRTVISPMAASIGASRLTSFLDGLDASRGEDPHLSLVGHSYGSLTAALSLRGADTAGVDELVAAGSPGLGFDDIANLSVPPGHTYVAEANGDVVADLGAFGADPGGMVGVRPLATDVDDRLGTAASDGHSEYLAAGTTSQHNIALVVAGRGDEVSA